MKPALQQTLKKNPTHRRGRLDKLLRAREILNIRKTTKMTGISTYLFIMTLNVNSLNFPIKRYRLADWIRKQDPTLLLARNNAN